MSVGRKKHGTVTAKELAVLLDVDHRTIGKFLNEGMPVVKRGRGGRASLYDPEACQDWKDARDAVAAVGVVKGHDIRARKELSTAMLNEQLHATRAGRLLDAEEVVKAWTAEIAGARAVILTAYTASADRVFRAAVTEGLAGVERELRALGETVLRELSLAPEKRPKKGRKKAA